MGDGMGTSASSITTRYSTTEEAGMDSGSDQAMVGIRAFPSAVWSTSKRELVGPQSGEVTVSVDSGIDANAGPLKKSLASRPLRFLPGMRLCVQWYPS